MYLVKNDSDLASVELKELHEKRRRFQLARLITLSEEMLDLARVGDWDKLEEIERLRRVELDECFALQAEQPSLLIAQALATLIHINDQVVFLVKQAKERVNTNQNKDRVLFQVAQTYQQQSLD